MRSASSEMVEWHRLSAPGEPFGISCDEDGPSIGPIRLFERTNNGLVPRAASELEFIFDSAFGRRVDMATKVGGLRAVAKALNERDLARAMIATLLTRLPTLPDEGAVHRAIRADTLAKAGFNPDELRDERGWWTSGGSAGTSSGSSRRLPAGFIPAQTIEIAPLFDDIIPRPLAPTPPFPGDLVPPMVGNPSNAVPRELSNPYPNDRKCAEEWAEAFRFCLMLKKQGKIGEDGYRGLAPTFEKCVRGQISERCGGNPVGGRRGSRYDIMA